MDSAAVVSDACDEPLYSRIDHSSSNESQREATGMAAAGSSISAPSNHDGMAILKSGLEVIKNALSYISMCASAHSQCQFSDTWAL